MTKKICIDCKWIRSEIKHAECGSPEDGSVSLVSGKRECGFRLCVTHRSDGWLECRAMGTCGKEGRWFEPKVTV